MDCNHIQELLPLYVGRDLDERRSTVLADHLQSCEACASSVNEYRESSELMQLYTPPPFDEAVFAGLRRNVLGEIEQRQAAPALSMFFARLFRPRISWAVATAVLIAISLSVFYVLRNRSVNQQRFVESHSAPAPRANDKENIAGPQDNIQSSPTPQIMAGGAGDRGQTPRPSRRIGATNRATLVATSTAVPRSTNKGVSPAANKPGDPDTVAAGILAAPEKTMRMEMQTRDPNIRIIWFSPQRTKHDSPNKSTKRNQEVRTNA